MPQEPRKYFFDFNNFDQPEIEEAAEDLPPPPPTFSLEEIGQARAEGFSEGRAAAAEESRQSREQYIAAQTAQLNNEIRALFLAEQMREKLYEKDVLKLCETIFSKAFPLLNATYGLAEVQNVIHKVLSTQTTAKIIIDVPESDKDAIAAYLENHPDVTPDRVDLRPSPDLSTGSCRISWQNGGALRDHTAIAEEIVRQLQQQLAPARQKSENNESKGE